MNDDYPMPPDLAAEHLYRLAHGDPDPPQVNTRWLERNHRRASTIRRPSRCRIVMQIHKPARRPRPRARRTSVHRITATTNRDGPPEPDGDQAAHGEGART